MGYYQHNDNSKRYRDPVTGNSRQDHSVWVPRKKKVVQQAVIPGNPPSDEPVFWLFRRNSPDPNMGFNTPQCPQRNTDPTSLLYWPQVVYAGAGLSTLPPDSDESIYFYDWGSNRTPTELQTNLVDIKWEVDTYTTALGWVPMVLADGQVGAVARSKTVPFVGPSVSDLFYPTQTISSIGQVGNVNVGGGVFWPNKVALIVNWVDMFATPGVRNIKITGLFTYKDPVSMIETVYPVALPLSFDSTQLNYPTAITPLPDTNQAFYVNAKGGPGIVTGYLTDWEPFYAAGGAPDLSNRLRAPAGTSTNAPFKDLQFGNSTTWKVEYRRQIDARWQTRGVSLAANATVGRNLTVEPAVDNNGILEWSVTGTWPADPSILSMSVITHITACNQLGERAFLKTRHRVFRYDQTPVTPQGTAQSFDTRINQRWPILGTLPDPNDANGVGLNNYVSIHKNTKAIVLHKGTAGPDYVDFSVPYYRGSLLNNATISITMDRAASAIGTDPVSFQFLDQGVPFGTPNSGTSSFGGTGLVPTSTPGFDTFLPVGFKWITVRASWTAPVDLHMVKLSFQSLDVIGVEAFNRNDPILPVTDNPTYTQGDPMLLLSNTSPDLIYEIVALAGERISPLQIRMQGSLTLRNPVTTSSTPLSAGTLNGDLEGIVSIPTQYVSEDGNGLLLRTDGVRLAGNQGEIVGFEYIAGENLLPSP